METKRIHSLLFSGLILLLTCSHHGIAQNFPAGFSRVLVANGLTNPTAFAFAPDGRIFICQQAGNVRVIKNNALLPTPFVSLSVHTDGERGLLGIAFDPDFASNQFVYLYHTLADGSRNRITRFTANGDVSVAGSAQIILDLDPLNASFHNGGAMNFGPDGKLYVAMGENSVGTNAQNLNTYHGKLLRINADGTVPTGNPYADGSEQRKRVWAHGLRNPFTFCFQPGTGKLYVNDVGNVLWEEINDATTGGLNFGWPMNEGVVAGSPYTNPVYAYGHGTGDGIGCAITGGAFFNPSTTSYPTQYYGKYFFLDLCGAWINYIDPATGATRNAFATNIGNQPVGLSVGGDGNLYYLSRINNALYRIVYTSSQAPAITNQPVAMGRFIGESATFSVSASGAQPLSYQWRKDGTNIPGATAIEFTINSVATADAGQYSVSVSNSFGSVVSNTAALTILGQNEAPVPTILTPLAGAMYRGGELLQFSGTATDAEDGTVPASRLSWQFVFHHDTHVHDSPPLTGISAGEFRFPSSGEISDNVFYRLHFTATDVQGRQTTVHRDILPHKSQITINSEPSGLQLTMDGQPITTPHTVTSVEGIQREIGAPATAALNGVNHEFDHWHHGGTATQTITTPQEDVTYVAAYKIITSTEGDLQEMITIYPNPVRNTFTIHRAAGSKIQLLDLAGKILFNKMLSEHVEQVQLEPSVNSGVYLLKISMHDKTVVKKIFVLR